MNQHSYIGKVPKTKRGQKTREKLLAAAEIEFGEKGFHDAAISGITTRAGVALGTFYIYFESKLEIFRALVAHMGTLTRHWIGERIEASTDRLEAEEQGLAAYIEFVSMHRNLYRIVSEAQFVAEDAFNDHYSIFARAYRQNLEAAGADNQIRQGDYEVWSWALIGISVFLGMRFAEWDDSRSPADTARAAAHLIRHGMRLPRQDHDS